MGVGFMAAILLGCYMTTRTKSSSPELIALYQETLAAFNGGVCPVFVGDLTVVIVEKQHFSPDIYFYNFSQLRSPLAELSNRGESLLFRPHSVKGCHSDQYLNEPVILNEMRALPRLIQERIKQVRALELSAS